MKNLNITITLVMTLVLIGCKNTDNQENKSEIKDSTVAVVEPAIEVVPPMDSAAMAKAWENYMTPSDMHKLIAADEGKWTGEIVSWMAPGAPPTPPSQVSAEVKMILGGRYQESIYKGDMMGMPFEGRGLLAYDNIKKKFINTWIDNMGTGVMVMEGTFEETTKSITLSGEMMDPSKGKEVIVRQVVTLSKKTQTTEMYYLAADGKEFKSMEIKLSKK